MYYVYILRCSDGSLYTGITSDPRRRFAEHMSGNRGAKYTRMRRPEAPVALWEAGTHADAARLEWQIKRLRRAQKLVLLENLDMAARLLPPERRETLRSVPKEELAALWPRPDEQKDEKAGC